MTAPSKQFQMAFEPFGQLLFTAAQSVLQRGDARTAALDALIRALPVNRPSTFDIDRDRITIGRSADLSADQQVWLENALKGLKPWRKGPFDIFGVQIDSEWNSALKWRRVAPHIAPLAGRRVLDVGSSNGYYLFRMAAQAPRLVLGIEPYAVYYRQFLALQHYLQIPCIHCLPLRLEDLAGITAWFDTLFCMGILYHRRSPLDTLDQLRRLIVPGGQLVLETLVVEGDDDVALFPSSRYACMRNVYFIPTLSCLRNWMARCGFHHIRCVDVTPTTTEEQRKTRWIDSESLDAFLDPRDSRLTLEGYPAPIRAVVIADAP